MTVNFSVSSLSVDSFDEDIGAYIFSGGYDSLVSGILITLGAGSTDGSFEEAKVRFEVVDADGNVGFTQTETFGFNRFGSSETVYAGTSIYGTDALALGASTLRATLDPDDEFAETDETDNVVEIPLTVFGEIDNYSEIYVSDESRRDARYYSAGDELRVEYFLGYPGTAARAALDATSYSLVLSSDLDLDAQDLVLASGLIGDADSENGSVNFDVVIPDGLDTGIYALGFKVNLDPALFGPDVLPATHFDSVKYLPFTSDPAGIDYEITADLYSISQSENGALRMNPYFSFYSSSSVNLTALDYVLVLSQDAVFDESDVVISEGDLEELINGSAGYDLEFVWPENWTQGYVGLIADPDETLLDRSDLGQGFDVSELLVFANAEGEILPVPGFDLYVQSYYSDVVTLNYDGSVSVSFDFGTQDVLTEEGTLVELALVEGAGGSEQITTLYSGNLVGAYDTAYFFVNLPNDILPGDQTIRITVDPDDLYAEIDETNNVADFEISIGHLTQSDFDDNGVNDILFFNEGTRAVGSLTMPDGGWSGIGRAGTGWEAVGTGRFDSQDGTDDVLWFNASTGSIGCFDMEAGQRSWCGLTKAGAGWSVAGVGDFDGDMIDDVLMFNASSGGLGQYRITDDGASWIGMGMLGADWEVEATGDINGDGMDDVVVQNASSGAVGYFEMSETGRQWKALLANSANGEVVGVGDFYEDGSDDLLIRDLDTGDLRLYFTNNGSISYTTTIMTGTGWEVAGIADLDGDKTDDILYRHEDGRLGQHQVYSGDINWQTVGYAGDDWDVIL